ncbi:ATP:cob(I)alamin adenosyltransferase [Candidatus Gottesmanbacteria bacterium RIFCSPLOWO2_01_FULL_43_11b]|uniref:Corrinoid adenosyltransferase n=1 Tax=Candidatus Gottesmanbacteria bacterium RIFCSPLOWO2_01_FULL_43_11b TaxID=1798392 RepID=A0A1F6AIE7_9BACT|nr:MAG: ATP:cob(I)alamin adenosyltransferase [Candidatus Gottesmanbacteria bacterium RIFCSPLOWO2_01_FULL_43_11b]
MPIYTKTGDTGMTSLFGGKRVLKCEELVDVYGSLDELNSWVGLIASQIKTKDIQRFLFSIQEDLFTIGSNLAGAKTEIKQLSGRVAEMEKRIDTMENKAGKLRNFILPGGSQLASFVHIARSICRRVERQTVALKQKEDVDSKILIYLNRLSDFLFMVARLINHEEHIEEVVWSGIDRVGKKK